MVVWIILGINRAFVFMNNTKLDVIATNLAREWVEMMYNIRDTNWRKYSGEKDKYWAYLWTWNDGEYDWFNNWLYVLHENTDVNGNNYIKPELLIHGYDYVHSDWYFNYQTTADSKFEETALPCYDDVDEFFDDDKCVEQFEANAASNVLKNVSIRNMSKVSFTWNYSYFSWVDRMVWNVQELIDWWNIEFYRILRVYEGIHKNEETPNKQLGHHEYSSDDEEPKELHFCVKVFYRNAWWKHAKELCSVMTNFME